MHGDRPRHRQNNERLKRRIVDAIARSGSVRRATWIAWWCMTVL